MDERIRVQAAPGLMCPMENNFREYIDDAQGVEVDNSTYYRRLIDDGSLILAPVKKAKGGDQ